MSHISLADQRICAWYESQTEETLRDLQDRFDAQTPRQAWTAFFNDFTPSADQGSGDSLAVPAVAQQGECIPTLEQFQRWLETQAHQAYHDGPTLALEKRIARCRAATFLLMEFKECV